MEKVKNHVFAVIVGCIIGSLIGNGVIWAIGRFTGSNKPLCAYCHNEVKSGTEIVYMPDGRKMHGECYLQYIEEGKNGNN